MQVVKDSGCRICLFLERTYQDALLGLRRAVEALGRATEAQVEETHLAGFREAALLKEVEAQRSLAEYQAHLKSH